MAALVTPIVLALRAEIRGSSRRGGFGLAECNFFSSLYLYFFI